jgi:hypothetical protein
MMCAMRPAWYFLLTLVPILALPARSDWTPLRKGEAASLSIDLQSVRRRGDEASFRYLVEFPTLQGDPANQVFYRSLVVSASVRCKARTIAIGNTDAYPEAGAQGMLLATKTAPRRAQFQRIEADTSDEDLWKQLCDGGKPKPKK